MITIDSHTWLHEVVAGKYSTFIIPLSTTMIMNALKMEPNVVYDIEEIGVQSLLSHIPPTYGGNVTGYAGGACRLNVHDILNGESAPCDITGAPEFVLCDYHLHLWNEKRYDIVLFFKSTKPSINGDAVERASLSNFLKGRYANMNLAVSDSLFKLIGTF